MSRFLITITIPKDYFVIYQGKPERLQYQIKQYISPAALITGLDHIMKTVDHVATIQYNASNLQEAYAFCQSKKFQSIAGDYNIDQYYNLQETIKLLDLLKNAGGLTGKKLNKDILQNWGLICDNIRQNLENINFFINNNNQQFFFVNYFYNIVPALKTLSSQKLAKSMQHAINSDIIVSK